MVRMTTSTVTAKAGNLLGSYPGGTFACRVLVAMTLTLGTGFESRQPKRQNPSVPHDLRVITYEAIVAGARRQFLREGTIDMEQLAQELAVSDVGKNN